MYRSNYLAGKFVSKKYPIVFSFHPKKNTMTQQNKTCLVCNQSQQQIPLINLAYQNGDLWICPQHLPVLIHNPQMLTGKLPGAEGMKPADHND